MSGTICYTATFKRLHSGDWGLRIEYSDARDLFVGDLVVVSKRDGSETEARIGDLVWHDPAERVVICRIMADDDDREEPLLPVDPVQDQTDSISPAEADLESRLAQALDALPAGAIATPGGNVISLAELARQVSQPKPVAAPKPADQPKPQTDVPTLRGSGERPTAKQPRRKADDGIPL